MEFLYGVIGCLAVLLLILGGGFAGWKLRGYADSKMHRREITGAEAEKILQERRALEEQQAAFHTLQNYSAELAYGIIPEEEIQRGGAE